ncbi:DUF1232 domain-containing protein [Candidatus Poribacteria bacterium]|nr:DUF1232 domain-containing protein [Candidatus Poribacteria bacterium]
MNNYTPLKLLKLIYHIPNFIRLFWRLLKDPRVPAYKKILPVTAGIICIGYIIFPFDFLPDPYAFIGHLDDTTVVLFIMVPSIWIFVKSCPKDLVKEHSHQISQRR